jgi:hypothetical protein
LISYQLQPLLLAADNSMASSDMSFCITTNKCVTKSWSILPPQQGTGEAKELQFAHGVVAATFFDLIFGERPKTGAAPEKLANRHRKKANILSVDASKCLAIESSGTFYAGPTVGSGLDIWH